MKQFIWIAMLWLLAMPAWACRCPDRTLGEYFDEATEVGVGRFVSVEDMTGSNVAKRRMLTFELLSPLHKTGRAYALHSDDMIRYTTADSSATCGVAPQVGDIVVFFGYTVGSSLLGIDSCSGTRTLRSDADETSTAGFKDVPATHVMAQLDALAGLEYLRAMQYVWPDDENLANDKLIGVVAINGFSENGETDAAAVTLRIAPDAGAPQLATIRRYGNVQSRESGYEVLAAVVYARRHGWYRLQLEDGEFGWLAPQHAGAFTDYETLVVNRLNYLRAPWQGFIWPDPGAGLPMRIQRPADEREIPVEVIDTTRIAGTLWLKINVLKASPCQSGDSRGVASGWVPAYRPDGEPAAWYYSRGC